jgi:hypothetical protein
MVRDHARALTAPKLLIPRNARNAASCTTSSASYALPGEPLRETIGFGHVRQKDFIEHCAIILALHKWDRRLLLARQTIWTSNRSF